MWRLLLVLVRAEESVVGTEPDAARHPMRNTTGSEAEAEAEETSAEPEAEAAPESALEVESHHRHSHKHSAHHAAHQAVHHAVHHKAHEHESRRHAVHAVAVDEFGDASPRSDTSRQLEEAREIDREASRLLEHKRSRDEWRALNEVRTKQERMEHGLEQAKLVEKQQRELKRRQAVLDRDVKKMEALKESSANLVEQIKEGENSLHAQLFDATTLMKQAKVESRLAMDYRHKLVLVGCGMVLVLLLSLGVARSGLPAALKGKAEKHETVDGQSESSKQAA